jgi:hypothetical protein
MITKTGLCKLDEEGTNEDMIYNNMEDDEIEITCELRSKFLCHVDMEDIDTIVNVNGAYITTKNNAIELAKLYGWRFSDINITDL